MPKHKKIPCIKKKKWEKKNEEKKWTGKMNCSKFKMTKCAFFLAAVTTINKCFLNSCNRMTNWT